MIFSIVSAVLRDDPAVKSVFSEIFGEFETALEAMWASPPTNPIGELVKICWKGAPLCGAPFLLLCAVDVSRYRRRSAAICARVRDVSRFRF